VQGKDIFFALSETSPESPNFSFVRAGMGRLAASEGRSAISRG